MTRGSICAYMGNSKLKIVIISDCRHLNIDLKFTVSMHSIKNFVCNKDFHAENWSLDNHDPGVMVIYPEFRFHTINPCMYIALP